MANFKEAFDNTGGHEGGWTVDNGGQTYRGISRKGWPTWEGWPLIDHWIRNNGEPRRKQFFNIPGLDEMVVSFYKKNYWDRIAGDHIKTQALANFIYDFYVNSNSALFEINRALSARITNSINEDSLKKINQDPAGAYVRIRQARVSKYTRLAKKPTLKKYEKGWFTRLNKFPKTISETA